jgi:hypothetical protein
VINEISARRGIAAPFVELFNRGKEPASLDGIALTDDPRTNKFRVPAGTSLAPGGLIAFDNLALGFSPDPNGGTIYLIQETPDRVLDAAAYQPHANDFAWGRSPDGTSNWKILEKPTPGVLNAASKSSDIVINEIMYAPLSRQENDEYVELFNRGSTPVNLEGWKLKDAVDYTFGAGRVIPAGGYLVVARNATNLFRNYAQLNTNNTVGNFKGGLSQKGERITLTAPVTVLRTNSTGLPESTIADMPVVQFKYGAGGRWGQWSKGRGSSLELIDPRADPALPSNWADSDETNKAEWESIETRGVCDFGVSTLNNVEVIMLEAGECLVDNVEVIGPAGTNLVVNSTFQTGLTNWFRIGNHDASLLDNRGFADGQCLRVVAPARGDPAQNRIRGRLSPPLVQNQTATIRAKVRWLAGTPEMILRIHGNYLESAVTLNVPRNLGTPGLPNSRAVPNAGPAISEVKHSPAVPLPGEDVVITARVVDPDGLKAVTLNYRIDPDTNNIMSVAMKDDGLGSDLLAGDGIFSVQLPGQPNGTLVAFSVSAIDAATPPIHTQFPTDAPIRECLIRFEPALASSLGTYRLWMTAATVRGWSTREKMSNQPLDVTFVYGHQRVVYNAGSYYSGSPFHSPAYTSPVGAPCSYVLEVPEDDQVLGTTSFHKLHWPGNSGNDETGQREMMSYWMAGQLGVPFNYMRFVNLVVNGVRRGRVIEDCQTPNGDMIEQWFPDDPDGDLYKIAFWFEFDDALGAFSNSGATLQNFSSAGQKKLARYRWNWQKRHVTGSAHDYTNIYKLVDVVTTNTLVATNFANAITPLIDTEQWMRTFAIEHICGNWDSYGYRNGQNMYAYKSDTGRWKMIPWDFNITLGLSSDGPSAALFEGNDSPVTRMYGNPPFRRQYLRAFADALAGVLSPEVYSPILEARSSALYANGLGVSSSTEIKTFLSDRRAYIKNQLGSLLTVPFALSGTNAVFTDTNSLQLTGSAPITVEVITLNGKSVPITWTGVTNWTIDLSISEVTNNFLLTPFDGKALQLAESISLTVGFTGNTNDLARYPRVSVNEWMASNVKTILDPADGDSEDWLELYNSETTSVDLSGWILAQNSTNAAAQNANPWIFPPGASIPAKGFLLLWLDNEPSQTAGSAYHATFKLDKQRDQIGLFARDGHLIDGVVFSNQSEDISIGSSPDGNSAEHVPLSAPTPGSANSFPRSPGLISLSVSSPVAGQVLLRWNSQPGTQYRLQSRTHLTEGAWLDGDLVAATENSTTRTIPLAQNSALYLRIRTSP